MPHPKHSRLIIGCMTGTSLDGIDAALIGILGRGMDMHARYLGMVSRPLGAVASTLRSMASGHAHTPLEFLTAARDLGNVHADAARDLLAHTGAHRADFVVAHGQTIWHAPNNRDAYGRGLSFQLMDPWPLVARCNIPVCYDLRQADLARHGQGAPITPIADLILYRALPRPALVVNLGGICNVTSLSSHAADGVAGGDIGPCNILLDGLVQRLFPGTSFDKDGLIARSGKPSDAFVQAVFQNPFFAPAAQGQKRSTGREDFTDVWVNALITQFKARGLSSADLIASGAEFVAQLIVSRAKQDGARTILLAGGGAKNTYLAERITHLAPTNSRTLTSDDAGIPVEAREAAGFAVLGALSQDAVPITLPQVTGSTAPLVAGTWAGLHQISRL
jgi:anhydro-N-acetylmuramic acid kinase